MYTRVVYVRLLGDTHPTCIYICTSSTLLYWNNSFRKIVCVRKRERKRDRNGKRERERITYERNKRDIINKRKKQRGIFIYR